MYVRACEELVGDMASSGQVSGRWSRPEASRSRPTGLENSKTIIASEPSR